MLPLSLETVEGVKAELESSVLPVALPYALDPVESDEEEPEPLDPEVVP